jgi:hypothetical protein
MGRQDRDSHVNWDATRALQSSPEIVLANYLNLKSWGAYNLVKVMNRTGDPGEMLPRSRKVDGYLTHLQAISGCTPAQMRDVLGLRETDLRQGALVYRLLELPKEDQIEVRGYTTLVDGVELKPGLTSDKAGYRPGRGAYQITLKCGVKIEAALIATLGPNSPFEPGVHPDIAKLYPPGHPARRNLSS